MKFVDIDDLNKNEQRIKELSLKINELIKDCVTEKMTPQEILCAMVNSILFICVNNKYPRELFNVLLEQMISLEENHGLMDMLLKED